MGKLFKDKKKRGSQTSQNDDLTLIQGIPWEKVTDPFKIYMEISEIGNGSMGKVIHVEKKKEHIGGSAYTPDKNRTKSIVKRMFLRKTKDSQDRKSFFEHSPKESALVFEPIKIDYAMKMIHLQRIQKGFYDELRNEIEILRRLDHPNIVKIYEIYDLENQIYVIMELCSGGDLWSRCPCNEKRASKIIASLTSAVSHMHKMGFCHRDIKMENIMLENRSADAQIKLIDFGLSTKFQRDERLTDDVGTIYTMAPEVLHCEYTNQADMWSIGVIAYILLSNQKPFRAFKRRHIIQKIVQNDFNFEHKIWTDVSIEAMDFIKSLMEPDTEKRITAERALASEWLTMYDDDEVVDPEFLHQLQQKMCVHAKSSILKKMSLLIVAHRSPGSDVSSLRKAFNKYDENNDGLISFEEFQSALDKFGYKEESLREMFLELDLDNSGMISYTEFVAATLETQGRIEEDKIAEAFNRIDDDGTGKLSMENLRSLMGQVAKSQLLRSTIDDIDLNNDGMVSYNEFRTLFEKNASLLYEENEEHYRKSFERISEEKNVLDDLSDFHNF